MDEDFNMIDKLKGLVDEKREKEEANGKDDVKKEEADDDEEEDEEIVLFDGGIKKKIIRKGEGATPPHGAKVKVHYTGTLLDGTKFDSSRDRNEPFEFEIGKGSVIKAWDEGVATMKVGERAILTCREDFAYGKNGSPPKIPGGATLVFDIDLLSFGDNEKDVSKEKDGSVMKIVVRKGEGYQNPNDSAVCSVIYTGSCNDKVFTKHKADKEVVLNIDTDLKMPDGLNEALQSMNKGEKATFKVRSDKGYGAQGNKELGIGPDQDLVYTIDLISFQNEKQSWDMNTQDKIESMVKKKKKGNAYYGMRKYKKACDFYSKAHGVFSESDMKKLGEDEIKEIKATQLSCHSNTALCKLKMKEFSECIESCDKALEIDKDHVKSLFRRGQAHAYKHDNSLALVDLKAAKKLNPKDAAIDKILVVVQKRLKNLKKKEKKLYANMFSKMTLAKGKNAGYPSDEGDSSSSGSSSSSDDTSESDDDDEGAHNAGESTEDKKDEADSKGDQDTAPKKADEDKVQDSKAEPGKEDIKEKSAAESVKEDVKEKPAAEPEKEVVKEKAETPPKKEVTGEKKATGSKKGKKKKVVKKKVNKSNKSNQGKKKVVKKKVKKKTKATKATPSTS